jgi:hypothetical protein
MMRLLTSTEPDAKAQKNFTDSESRIMKTKELCKIAAFP